MSNIQLLQGKEYIRSLYETFDYAHKIRIETLTLNPIIADILIPQAKAGAKIEVLTNPLERTMIHKPDFITVRTKLREAGIKVFCFNAPYLHHQKIILIDPDIVYLGSHNISQQSLNANIETSVRFRHYDIYTRLLNNFKLKTGQDKENEHNRQIKTDTGQPQPEPTIVYDISET